LQYCQEGIDAVLICGDLTSCGDLDGYRDCIGYLKRSLLTSCSPVKQKISVVPGNHDIDRRECDPAGTDIYKKFQPLHNAWETLATDILTTKNAHWQSLVTGDHCKFTVFAVNSCIGCGEQRYLPSQIRSELWDLFEKVSRTSARDESFDLLGEVLDTPAFSADDVDTVRGQINKLPLDDIPIVVGHHNILPQKRPRVSLYSEVLNAGYIRSRLSRCSRPVIYCHGHIHQDPVEIVTPPELTSSRLICVAAPEFKDGFNLIELEYGEKNLALGCVVRHMRIGDDGALEARREVRVPLWSTHEREKVGHQRISDFIGAISNTVKRFQDIVAAIREHTGSRVQETTVADVLLECEWLGLIQIDNRADDKRHWQIKGF